MKTPEQELKEKYSMPTGWRGTVIHEHAIIKNRSERGIPIEPQDKPSFLGSNHFKIPSIGAICFLELGDKKQGWGRNPAYDYWVLELPNGKTIRTQNFTFLASLITLKHKKATA